jgi:hypothetical protein
MSRKNASGYESEAASMFEEEDFDAAYRRGLPAAEEATEEPNGDDDMTEGHGDDEPEQDDSQQGADSEGERVAGYEVHPAAAQFPLLQGAAFDELVESIRKHGQLVPVVIYRGLLLDGRNRARAVERLQKEGQDIALITRDWQPSDVCQSPVAFVMAMNLHRRDLTDDQRAQIAAALLPMLEAEAKARQEASRFKKGEKQNPEGRNQHAPGRTAEPDSAPPSAKAAKNKAKAANSTRGKVASTAKVSRSKAAGAIEIQKKATREVAEAVKAGKMTQRAARRTIQKGKGAKETKPFDLNVEVPKRWETLKKPFASAEMPEVRRIVLSLIQAEGKG